MADVVNVPFLDLVTAWDRLNAPLYLAIRSDGRIAGGGRHPHAYKTIKGARKAAGVDGVIVLFDLSLLMVVHDDPEVDGVRLSQRELCDRQATLWGARAAEIEHAAKDGRITDHEQDRARERKESAVRRRGLRAELSAKNAEYAAFVRRAGAARDLLDAGDYRFVAAGINSTNTKGRAR